ncbi:MAG: D-2-hydroxyacid dehydrogenase [Chloroflexi bacterium]|nr:D-2-hydroxyacid dehydrogenase [Chloroflexota bacterium]
MRKIKVLLGMELDEEQQKQLASVSPSLEFVDILPYFQPGVTASETLRQVFEDAEVLFGANPLPVDLLSIAPKLRWIHLRIAGADRWEKTGLLDSNIVFTTSRGTPSINIAEFIVMTMLMFAKRAPEYFKGRKDHRWELLHLSELHGKTVGIVGLGGVGNQTAKLCKAMGMRILAIRRSAQRTEENVQGVDVLLPPQELHQLLSPSDYVVITCPLTPETYHLIGEREFQVMKPTAYVINTSRGPIIDEQALIKALKNGVIAGAGLDVFEKEPLPPESELWEMPNVILTPHVSGDSKGRWDRVVSLFCENLTRYIQGKELLNIYDKAKRY